ncbi:transmembrane helix containing protein [Aeromonas phage vB_AspA_Tola]|nr:transmembrane helix containing protein [Aeromonas phage vB_AspA_Tola]
MREEAVTLADMGAKVAPPMVVSGVTILGLRLEDWVYIATIVYTVMQMHYLMKGKGTYKQLYKQLRGKDV